MDNIETIQTFPIIIFSEFNTVRNARGVDAARFDLVDEDGDSYWLWMSEVDIRKNIMQFPHCRDELEKGLRRYDPFNQSAKLNIEEF